jgi:UDP-2,3-diacylglucosamine pyrophosphatase LpxH
MLIIVSDLHLTDGTCGRSISSTAFKLFADRLGELVHNASWRLGSTYRPVREVDLILLGDILDPQHSTLWLEKADGSPNSVRPWTDYKAPEFAATVRAITANILKNNAEAIQILKNLTGRRALSLPPADRRGRPARLALYTVPVKVNIHYMVGNHDWFYHLPGAEFDAIRAEVIQAFGLSNSAGPFPHQAKESDSLEALLDRYQVYAQHGDLYDAFNYDKESQQGNKRDSAALGDAFAVEILNRFPVEVERQMKGELPPGLITALRELVNVRPALATPLWISSQLRQNNVPEALQNKLKNIWDELGNQFLTLPFVRSFDKKMKFDIVDGLEALIKITDRVSFKTIDSIVVWLRKKFWSEEEVTFAKYALREDAFLNRKAQFVVYGHTHRHEVVPLDSIPASPAPTNQTYLNSGTWHTYFDLAVHKPEEQKFIPYQVLAYLTFYRDGERGGRRFEAWSGSFSE